MIDRKLGRIACDHGELKKRKPIEEACRTSSVAVRLYRLSSTLAFQAMVIGKGGAEPLAAARIKLALERDEPHWLMDGTFDVGSIYVVQPTCR